MRLRPFLLSLSFTILIVSGIQHVIAHGGTSIIATRGQPVQVLPRWPGGVSDIVNDPVRGKGWNCWFSEWPNDVNQYALQAKSADDLNRLIRKLAAVKTELRQIRLSYLKEPQSLGWVTRLPEGNGIPVIFSIGDQSQIDQWYARVRNPFGVMEFIKAPEAVPPTLTVFVQNSAVQLDQLEIPAGITVSSGDVPTVFHRFNTTIERDQQKKAAEKKKLELAGAAESKLDATSRAAQNKIAEFLKQHSATSDEQ